MQTGTETKNQSMLMFSSRGTVQWLSTSYFYEFEDLIQAWHGSELMAPPDTPRLIRRKAASFVHQYLKQDDLAARFFSPSLAPKKLDQDYDFFFATLPTPDFTYKIADFGNLRERCRKMVCYLPETWSKRLHENLHTLPPLRQFDHLFVSTLNSVETLEKLTGVPTHFMPFGIDALKFSPFPFFPERHIDVLNIGRRSPDTHAALLEAAEKEGRFYQYDTVGGIQCKDARDHRALYANMAKRSKFFISNTANFDELFKTGGAVEIGHRFYEGAAGGAVLLGHYPDDHEIIRTHFDWPDAIVKTDYHAGNIMDVIRDLEAQPERLLKIRADNIRNCLLRHDFVYRWEEVLGTLGLTTTPAMEARKAELSRLAGEVETRLRNPGEAPRAAHHLAR